MFHRLRIQMRTKDLLYSQPLRYAWLTYILFVTALFILFFTTLTAQQMMDVVYLKNGSIIRGIIIEQVPNTSLTIKTADGNVFVFSLNDIEKMTREEPQKALQSLPAPPAVNSVYLELGGNAFAYSVNYDRVYDDAYVLRAGLGYFGAGNIGIAIIPITGSYLIGRTASKFEVGIGLTIITGTIADFSAIGSASAVIGTGILAYRYQPTEGGFFFRGGITPFFNNAGFVPWYALGFGVSF